MSRLPSVVAIAFLFFSAFFFNAPAAPSAGAAALPPDSTADVVYGQESFSFTYEDNADTLTSPFGVAMDGSGNLYIVDRGNNRVLYYPAGSTTATYVYGQGGSFTTDTANTGGVSADSLDYPSGAAVDDGGGLYVADTNNNRVLYYPSGSPTATRVYGQGGSFTTNTQNKGGVSADSLASPFGVAVDSGGNLYVADNYNNRVLYYPSGSTTATRVYGQGGSFTTNTANKGGRSADTLGSPYGVAVDSGGNLYVVDRYNHRVLYYPSGSTTATRVYGQGGSFTAGTANMGGISADTLAFPAGLTVDSSGNLYVADSSNHRVLYYPSGSTTATRVYGQSGSFNTDTENKGGRSADSLDDPYGVAVDGSGNLYVADPMNGRVLYYLSGSTTATRVYPKENISADSLESPVGVTVDGGGNLYVVDRYNNRALYYPAGSTTATRVYGQGGSFTTGTKNLGGISANSLYYPMGLAVDGNGNLYVADSSNHRVLYYPAGSTTATRVYGQGGSFTTNTANQGGLSADSLSQPTGIAVDGGGNLYIVDRGNSRVLYYPAGSTTATRVYGQGGVFTTNTAKKGGLSADSLDSPIGIAVDGSGNLYVADNYNNRVLYYPSGSTTATRVYGQGGSFTTNTANKGGLSADTLGSPFGVAVDSGGNLYVVDRYNHRALYYPAGSTTATHVYGQSGSFTSNTWNKGGISADTLDFQAGVAVDGSGNLYVADYENSRVLEYRLDVASPVVSAFAAASPSASLTIAITAFSAEDDDGVTGYRITASATPPEPDAPGWSATAPASYTVTAPGTYTLYPWAKDAAGNVSAVYTAPVTVVVLRPTTLTLTAAPNPVPYGQPVTLTARVTATEGVTPTGSLTLTIDAVEQVLPLDDQGQASYVTSDLPAGEHTVSATYAENAHFLASSAGPQSLTVEPYRVYLPAVSR